MNKNKRFVKNYIYNMSYELLALLVPLITVPYVSRVLGASAIGDYGFPSGVVSYFGIIAALGTQNYAKKEIAFSQSDERSRSSIFWEIFLFRIISTFIVLICYLTFIQFSDSEFKTLYIIQLITVLSWILDFSWLFQGMENFKITAIRNTIVKVISTLLVFLFVKSKTDLNIYAIILSGSILIGNITLIPNIKKYVVRVPIRQLDIRRHLSGILIMFSSVVAVQIYTVVDQTMLGILVNNTEVGYYSQAQKIIKVALTVVSSYALILLPRVAVLFKTNNKKEMNKYVNLSIDYLFFLALPLTVGVLLCASDFVPVYFGAGYEPVAGLMRVLSILFIVTGAGQLAGSFLTAINKQIQCTIAVGLGALINVALNIVLIKRLSSIGACVASVIAELTVTLITVFVINKMFSLKYGIKSFFYYLIPTTTMGLSIIGLQIIMPSDVIRLIVEVVMALCVYFGVLLFMKDSLLYKILNRRK